MFQLPSFSFWSRKYPTASATSDSACAIRIPPTTIHTIDSSADKRTRTLKHLIRANNVNHAIIYHDLRFHNHMPHILGSSYLLGASPDQLTAIYDQESKELEPWPDSPGEVAKHDWRDYLGDRRYQRAFVHFFEDELANHFAYDWQKLTEHYLLEGEEPLINGIIAGLGHPLIHLSYAYTLSNHTVAVETLGLATSSYNQLHKYLDDPSYTFPSETPTISVLSLLERIRNDSRFSSLSPSVLGAEEPLQRLESHESVVLEYWNSWTVETDPVEAFKLSQEAAVLLLCATSSPPLSSSDTSTPSHDFFLVHLLTTSHAVRVLLPLLPAQHHISLLRQWWLLAITTYVTQQRPEIHANTIDDFELKNRDWAHVEKDAIEGKHRLDAHYVKAIRAMKEAQSTWGGREEWWLKAAVLFADTFTAWGGFGEST